MAKLVLKWSRTALLVAWFVLPVLCLFQMETTANGVNMALRDPLTCLLVMIAWLVATHVVAWMADGWGKGVTVAPTPPVGPAPVSQTRIGDAAGETRREAIRHEANRHEPLDVKAELGLVETKVLMHELMSRYDIGIVTLGRLQPGTTLVNHVVMSHNVTDQAAFFDAMAAMVRGDSWKRCEGDELTLGN